VAAFLIIQIGTMKWVGVCAAHAPRCVGAAAACGAPNPDASAGL